MYIQYIFEVICFTFHEQFFERLRFFEEETERKRAELKETLDQETRELYEKKLAGQYKISERMDEDAIDPLVGEQLLLLLIAVHVFIVNGSLKGKIS